MRTRASAVGSAVRLCVWESCGGWLDMASKLFTFTFTFTYGTFTSLPRWKFSECVPFISFTLWALPFTFL